MIWKSKKRQRLDELSEPQRGEVEHFIVSRRKVGFAFLLLVLVFVAQGVWLAQLQSNAREASREVRIRFAATDSDLCNAFNRIRGDDRATIAAGPKETGRLLKLLGLSPEARAKVARLENAQTKRELARRPPLKCSQLPSLKIVR